MRVEWVLGTMLVAVRPMAAPAAVSAWRPHASEGSPDAGLVKLECRHGGGGVSLVERLH